MADAYEQNLPQKTNLTTNDYVRVVGSDDVSYKQPLSDVAQKTIENYAGSTLAGSTQSVKGAIDGLKSSATADKAELNASINEVASDLASESSTRASQDTNLQAQINQLVAPTGTAPNPAEIENARIGADNVTYTTLGDAIRTQVSDLKSDIGNSYEGFATLDYYDTFVLGTLDADGATNPNSGRWRIANSNKVSFDRDILLRAKSGYMFLIAVWGSTYISPTTWYTSYFVPANTEFKLSITTDPQDTSTPADLGTFVRAVTFDSTIGDLAKMGSLAYADVSAIVSQSSKNLMPVGYKETTLRGLKSVYNNGVFSIEGTASGSGFDGRTIHLTDTFTLPAGSYVVGASTDSSTQDAQWFVERASDNAVIATGNYDVPINRVFTLTESTELYIGVNVTGGTYYDITLKLQIEKGAVSTSFVPSITANDVVARANIAELDYTMATMSIINRFDKDSSDNLIGKYMPSNEIYDNADYTVSHYIDLIGLSKIMTSYIHMFSWFDENKTYLSHVNVAGYEETDIPLEVPSGARYARCSFPTAYKDKVQIGSNISRYDYAPYGYFRTPMQKEVGSVTIVDVNGNGDYTSLLEAMINTSNDVIVRYGEYDLVAEYQAYFGNDYFSNPTAYNAGDFAHGLYISERTVTFDAGSRVIYDLSDIDVSYTEGGADRRFSAIMVGHNAKIIGLNCVGIHNWYVVHDDGGAKDYDYTNEFIDCHIVGANLVNTNVIGAGCQTRSKTIIDGCYLDNGIADPTTRTIRYHNTPYTGKPQIIVKDTYVNGRMFFQYYGTQTEKGRIMVNNCSMASAIDVSALSDGMSENWELFAWNNEIRN